MVVNCCGNALLVKLAAAQTHRLWQAGKDYFVAMLGISALG